MKRYVIIGAGARALSFARGMLERHADLASLVALQDLNGKRMKGFCDIIGCHVPSFTDFDDMVKQARPDAAIICTRDDTHPYLVEKSLAFGLDVILEKPMAIDKPGIRRIIQAENRYGRKIQVTFNMRFQPYTARLKELLLLKPIGEIKSVHAEWMIDKTHGKEYFRRWNAHMESSGGLLVHKATHNFDLLNWFLDDSPVSVGGLGSRQIFGDAGAFRGTRCRDCERINSCWAAMRGMNIDDADLFRGGDDDVMKKLYFDAEDVDGYFRDRCVFDRSIDIYDTMNLIIMYSGGTQVSYTLSTYSPYQGYRLAFTGTDGRIEAGQVSNATPLAEFGSKDYIRVITGTNRQDISVNNVELESSSMPHGGGDSMMFSQIFGKSPEKFGQVAGVKEGAISALVGICANQAIASGRIVSIPSIGELMEDEN